jgi:adenosine kinase
MAQRIQYILPPNSVVYTGSVGDDELAEKLRAANDREGVHSAYYVRKGAKTGVCAAIITNHDRSGEVWWCYMPPVSLANFKFPGLW